VIFSVSLSNDWKKRIIGQFFISFFLSDLRLIFQTELFVLAGGNFSCVYKAVIRLMCFLSMRNYAKIFICDWWLFGTLFLGFWYWQKALRCRNRILFRCLRCKHLLVSLPGSSMSLVLLLCFLREFIWWNIRHSLIRSTKLCCVLFFLSTLF